MTDAQMSGEDLWQRLIAANREYLGALYAVRDAAKMEGQTRRDLIELLRRSLTSATHQHLAVEVMRHLDEEFRRAVFFEIVHVEMTSERDGGRHSSSCAIWIGSGCGSTSLPQCNTC